MNERERIEYIISIYGLSPSQFADKTGIPRASVSHILSGRNKPSLEILQKVAAMFPKVDLNWLVLGKGNMPVAEKDVQIDENNNKEDVGSSLFADDYAAPLNNSDKEVKKTMQQKSRETNYDFSRIVKSNQSKTSTERSIKKNTQSRTTAEAARYIKEIRVFYSDGTFEILYPEK